MKSALYDWMYRIGAPWDSVGVRTDLVDFLAERSVAPGEYPRAIDLGCGTGANVVHLAERGFAAHGVDFSEVAIRKARARADEAGVSATFVRGDLTAESIEGVAGSFDLIVDFGTLDDLRGDDRRAMAKTITRLSRPGSLFLEYCFFGETKALPRFSFKGASRYSHLAPGELEDLLGEQWDVDMWREYPDWNSATFILTRR